jgi:hypothetical protein
MRVSLRRRIAFVAALIVPAVAALALSASPALAALPRYGRLVLGTHHTVSPLAILIVVLGTAAGLGLLAIDARRRSHLQNAAVRTIPVRERPPTDAADGGRRAA